MTMSIHLATPSVSGSHSMDADIAHAASTWLILKLLGLLGWVLLVGWLLLDYILLRDQRRLLLYHGILWLHISFY